jgi:hypothetical protein
MEIASNDGGFLGDLSLWRKKSLRGPSQSVSVRTFVLWITLLPTVQTTQTTIEILSQNCSVLIITEREVILEINTCYLYFWLVCFLLK